VSDKTEAPTAKRLAEARSEGNVARSQEVVTAASLLMGVWLLSAVGTQLSASLKAILYDSITGLASLPGSNPNAAVSSLSLDKAPSTIWVRSLLIANVERLLPSFGMILIGLLATGVIGSLAQTGLLWASKKLGFKFHKLNPATGLKRMFSAHGLFELSKAILKLGVVGLIAYTYLNGRKETLATLAHMNFADAVSIWLGLASGLAMQIAGAYLLLGAADYLYIRWRYINQLKMTKEEVKEEAKQQEGDPLIKSRIRGQMRRLARMRMMANVPRADVIITNPTHLAVAIQYVADEMSAPKVVAKGADHIAARIIQIARANNIPVVQNIPLARAMYKAVEIDHEIPAELYAALAEVLAYVYKLKGKLPTQRPVQPAPETTG
jgi:flagellar biosynthetic protein FlhB